MIEGLVVADVVDESVTEALVMAKVVDESVTEALVVAERHGRDRGGNSSCNYLAMMGPNFVKKTRFMEIKSILCTMG